MDGWIENNNNSCTLVENLLQWQHIFREVIYRLLYVGPSLWSGGKLLGQRLDGNSCVAYYVSIR